MEPKIADIFPVSVALARGKQLNAPALLARGTKVCVQQGYDQAAQPIWSCYRYKSFYDAAWAFTAQAGAQETHRALASTDRVEWL